MDELQQLQKWYSSQCNQDWEHSFGVKIDTLDNPGWTLEIDFRETNLAERAFAAFSRGNSEDDADISVILAVATAKGRECTLCEICLAEVNLKRPPRIVQRVNLDAEAVLPVLVALRAVPLLELLKFVHAA